MSPIDAAVEAGYRPSLENGKLGHSFVAGLLTDCGYAVSETAVRRWRKKHGIELEQPLPEAIPEAVVTADDPEYLKGELVRVGRALDKEKARQNVLYNAVYSAVKEQIAVADQEWLENGGDDEWANIATGNTSKFLSDNMQLGDEEVAVALVSDLQLAKVTKKGEVVQYNSEIAERRMQQYAAKILNVTNVQRADHPINKIVVPVLGDIIEGEEIFPGQMHLIDGGLYRQIVVDGPRIFKGFFDVLLENFDEVEVVWVPGNHGRIGGESSKLHDPETNGDRMLGKILELMYAYQDRIKFKVTDGQGEKNWFDFVEIGAYRALCIHGNQIPGGGGLPFNGVARKVNGWAAGAIEEPFQDMFMGHYHTRAVIPVNKRNVYINGSFESYSTYAQEVLAAMSEPSQWLLFVHPERGRVTASYGVELT